jgi:PAS domain S-box-containing protein
LNAPSNPLSSIGAPGLAPHGEILPAPAIPPRAAVARALAEQLPVAVLVVDHRGVVELANRAAQELCGLAANDLAGMTLAELAAGAPEVERALAAARRGAAGSAEVRHLGVGAGRDDAPLRLSLLPVPEHGGALVLAAAAPTAGPEPDDPLKRLATLGRVSAGMAHEIRNPLAGIGTNAQVLRRRLDADDPRRRAVDFILEEVARLDRLIEELLQFARPPAPRLAHHDLRDAIERALTLAKGRIDAARVALRLRVEGEPPAVFVDPEQMAQVILNVILNAVQAMPAGGELAIGLRVVERLGPTSKRAGRRAEDPSASAALAAAQVPLRRFLELEIKDTGVGIAEGDLPKLFEPFFTTRAAGTGLGLAVSEALVRQHGGAIAIESELGRGTAVTILIPVEKRRGPR